MLNREMQFLIESSIYNPLQKDMLDLVPKVHALITESYPMVVDGDVLGLANTPLDHLDHYADINSAWWGIYFDAQGTHCKKGGEVGDYTNKAWHITLSLRSPLITCEADIAKYEAATNKECKSSARCSSTSSLEGVLKGLYRWWPSQDSENPDMVNLCKDIARKCGVYYVAHEDLKGIKIEATEEMKRLWDRNGDYFEHPSAYNALF
ncbi:MAG: hypothetical protein B7Y40_00410 [Gammaproteobacteria bacterium 28-57-27]|nr:MAG: hypothetical protein B7Y40_00410 [Gammaproteobacteria bacterium 28-57-27]